MSRALGEKIQSAALTDVGVTRSENQDACALFASKGQSLIAAVADGMGGHAGGATASRIAIQSLHDFLSPTNDDVGPDDIVDAIATANDQIYREALDHPDLRGMGTTVVVLLVRADGRTWVAHVGDSRAYLLRSGHMAALTHDHSLVAELVRQGVLTEEQAEHDPRRNEILRSVGAAESVQVDVTEIDVAPGDRFVLCSDGLTGCLSDADIAAVLGAYDPDDATRDLIARANHAGSPDNVTAVCLHYPDPSSATDTHQLTAIPETTAAELNRLELEDKEAQLERARRLMLLVAAVGIALILAVLGIVITSAGPTPTIDRAAQPPIAAAGAATEAPPMEASPTQAPLMEAPRAEAPVTEPPGPRPETLTPPSASPPAERPTTISDGLGRPVPEEPDGAEAPSATPSSADATMPGT